MTDRELMQQALEALMAADPDDMIFDAEGHMVFRKDVAINALRDSLAQPKTPDVTPEVTPHVIDCPRCGHCCPQPNQEPVAWMTINEYGEEDDIHYENPEGHLLEGWTYKPLYTHPPAAQPEQEPAKDNLDFWALFDETQRLRAELKFNATPPQQWVGLTDEEIKSLPSWWPSYEDAPALVQLVKDVEAKLKEKNG